MKILPIILAGGLGRRLYPISTPELPKQFIPLLNDGNSLFQATVRRLRMNFQTETIVVLCNEAYTRIVERQLREVNDYNYSIIAEPERHNTFASVVLALKYTQQIENTDVMLITPSDSYIENNDAFCSDVQKSCIFSYSCDKHVLFGIQPTEPNTNYGYIQINKNKSKIKMKDNYSSCIFPIKQFTEKPNIEKAKCFVKNNGYYWNSGSFVLNTKTLTEDIQQLQQSTISIANEIKLSTLNGKQYLLSPDVNNFSKLPNIAFDRAIIEKAQNIVCCIANFDWVDIGSFEKLTMLIEQGKVKNVVARREVENYLGATERT